VVYALCVADIIMLFFLSILKGSHDVITDIILHYLFSLKDGTLNMEILVFKSKFPREVLLCRVCSDVAFH
jgi:hypothetical protein